MEHTVQRVRCDQLQGENQMNLVWERGMQYIRVRFSDDREQLGNCQQQILHGEGEIRMVLFLTIPPS